MPSHDIAGAAFEVTMRSWLSIAAVMLALPAAAQDHPGKPPAPRDVVVVGNKAPDAKAQEKQIRDFVRGMTRTPGRDPLARFDNGKVCPLVSGLSPDKDKAITERMRRIAAAAGIAVGPAAMWQLEGVVNRDGVTLRKLAIGGPYLSRSTIAASRLTASARPVYLMSIVVIERRAVNGLCTTEIADYVTMRALTDASPARARETGAPTLLTVLEPPMGSEMPLTITAWDMSFLRGRYATPANLFASAQRGAIGEAMKREIGRGDAPAR